MMKKPLVSIITPCYNSANYISETIKSVQNQVYNHWEMIITDDGSTDNSVKIIEKFIEKDSRIKLFRINNSGAAVARNYSIKNAKGVYIAFLDSDDTWFPKKLDIQIDFMMRNDYCFSFTSYHLMDQNGNILNKIRKAKDKVNYQMMLTSNKIGCLTAVYNQEKIGKFYMPIIRKRQDYALWLSILKKVDHAYGLNQVLGTYRLHDLSMSSKKSEMIKWNWKLYREIEKKGIIVSVFLILCNMVNKMKDI